MTDSNFDLLQELDPQPTDPPNRRMDTGSILILVGVLVTAAVVGIALLRGQQTQPTEGTAPDFEITTFDGETWRLSDQRGSIVLLNFWASWCPPCRDEAPLLEAIWQDYRDQGVVVVGVAFSDTETNSRNFIDEFRVTYPNGSDIGTTISKGQYHIIGVPETFIIDRDGNIRRFFFQLMPNNPNANADDDLFVTDASVRATLDMLIAETPLPPDVGVQRAAPEQTSNSEGISGS